MERLLKRTSACFRAGKKQDLFKLGEQVYHYDAGEMEDRYYYSGGSVRMFTLPTIDFLQTRICFALRSVTDVNHFANMDDLCHTFIDDVTSWTHFTASGHWQNMVDSEYAVRMLALRLPLDALFLIYNWARATELGSLAGCALEICIFRLAADNQLTLKVSEYKPDEPRHFDLQLVSPRVGRAVRWGTSDNYKTYLEEWRGNDELTYWLPSCANFPNIDSIVKLRSTTSGKEKVAYLQIPAAKQHDISRASIMEINKIFHADNSEPPIFIVICPNKKSCKKFVLNSRPEVASLSQMQVFVGYSEIAELFVL
ncbi:hypothetical protein GN958_ATG16369 [Phytophthora infestans]|uniref:Crinkler (CRN) family protein n=1 Tax=Phytophthora infestans TaxID=4787 RepID=A0A8S9U6D3_PHYIN|nr:hypothetical protein GN958_ATG16369 [Phytophthora infestans]